MSAGFLLLRAAPPPTCRRGGLGGWAYSRRAIAVYAWWSFQLLALRLCDLGVLVLARRLLRERASGARGMRGNELLGLLLCAAAT